MKIIKGIVKRPRRVLLYGTHGIGKSTWAASAPSPIFLTTEDGLSDIGVDRTPLLKDLGAFNNWVSDLLTQTHEYRTVVVDTLDWLERLIFNDVAQSAGKDSIEDFGYGKGYGLALTQWEFVLKSLGYLRDKGMAVILLAHARIVKVEPPDRDSYTRYEPDLHKSVSPMLQEWVDEVLFATYKMDVKQSNEGFNKKRGQAIGDGERVVCTCEKPTHLAKRRVQMPDEIPLKFAAYANYLKSAKPEANGNGNGNGHAANIAGMVTNGSSKQPETSVPPLSAAEELFGNGNSNSPENLVNS